MKVSDKNKLNDLSGKEWIKHTKSFFKSTKSKIDKSAMEHPAPYLFEDTKFLVEMFTKKDHTILDPFAGSGTTLLVAADLKRKAIGFDLQEKFENLYLRRANEFELISKDVKYEVGDSLKKVKELKDESIDYVITSPPYHNILNNKNKGIREESENFRNGARIGVENYSDDSNDLGNQETFSEFMKLMSNLFSDIFLKLKKDKYITIVISDFTINKRERNIQGDIVKMAEEIGFKFVGTQILLQDSKPLYPFGYPYKFIINHHHQNVIHFLKPK